MKKIATLLTLIASMVLIMSATFTIGWDARPATDGVTGYLVYSGPTNAPAKLEGTSATNSVSLTKPDGAYRLTVTSTNVVDESFQSIPLYVIVDGTNVWAISMRPGAPLNLQLLR